MHFGHRVSIRLTVIFCWLFFYCVPCYSFVILLIYFQITMNNQKKRKPKTILILIKFQYCFGFNKGSSLQCWGFFIAFKNMSTETWNTKNAPSSDLIVNIETWNIKIQNELFCNCYKENKHLQTLTSKHADSMDYLDNFKPSILITYCSRSLSLDGTKCPHRDDECKFLLVGHHPCVHVWESSGEYRL